MSETKHSPEPWRVEEGPHRWAVVDANERAIIQSAVCADWCSFPDEATKRRIVACVNACAGLPTDLLEAMAPGRLRTLTEGWGGDWERRVRAALKAVGGIPVEALEAGALEKAIEWLELSVAERNIPWSTGSHQTVQGMLRALGRIKP